MAKFLEVTVVGQTATVRVLPDGNPALTARALLDAARHPDEVRTITGPGIAFHVPLAVARKAGLIDKPTTRRSGNRRVTPHS